ncbi:nucleotidyltransferase domain-containing protein [Thermus parvatiensis]|uniref:nucleotidyltransferase domain-containing protein n=1 Tax=Thermus parvatiensis TaxID=456163 RepID=UPI000ADC3FC9|nr:nucleotidyltransferase domain-containing protein [Thermus parvatiensis]
MTRVFRFDPKARLKEVAEAAKALGERSEVLAVVLFGSLARGRPPPSATQTSSSSSGTPLFPFPKGSCATARKGCAGWRSSLTP